MPSTANSFLTAGGAGDEPHVAPCDTPAHRRGTRSAPGSRHPRWAARSPGRGDATPLPRHGRTGLRGVRRTAKRTRGRTERSLQDDAHQEAQDQQARRGLEKSNIPVWASRGARRARLGGLDEKTTEKLRPWDRPSSSGPAQGRGARVVGTKPMNVLDEHLHGAALSKPPAAPSCTRPSARAGHRHARDAHRRSPDRRGRSITPSSTATG